MKIIIVNDSKTEKEFLNVVNSIYKNDQAFIRPLDQDIEKVFDSVRNPFFKHGKCVRWILKNHNNHTIGRVAAFINEKKAFNYDQNLVKVPSLDGAGKMSKSENQMATLYLADSDEMIRKKVMKAKTDSGPVEKNAPKPDYIENIFLLMGLVCEAETVQRFEEAYNNCTIRYGDLKKQLAEDMVNFIAPIRNKVDAILQDQEGLKQIMQKGAEKANKSAGETMKLVREAIGLNYF